MAGPPPGPWGSAPRWQGSTSPEAPRAGPWAPATDNAASAAAERTGLPDNTAIGAADFLAAQRANRRRTVLLLTVLTLIAAGLGYLVGWYLDAGSQMYASAGVVSVSGVLVALGLGAVSIIWSSISLAWGGRMVMAMTGGHEASKETEQQLFNVVEEMSIASGQPMPRVFIIEDEAMNAFATGTSSRNAAIGVTRGLLNGLNREELQGVIGHEMGHIANLDMRYMTVVGVTVGLIALVSDMILRFMNWGTGRSRDRSGGSGGAAAILLVVLVVVALLAPLAAKLVQFAVSRQREYLADATSVQFTRNSAGLISALQKLTAAAQPFSGVSRATQHLFIVNPLRQFGAKASALMATHPATEDRIARLRALGP